jgi:hypothetical protein
VVYLISTTPSRQEDSAKLINYLQKNFPTCSQILPSQYLVRSEASSLALVVDIVKRIGAEAGLLVTEVTQNLAWHNLKIEEAAMERWEAEARDCDAESR